MPRRPNPMYSPNPPTATDTGQPDVWEVPHMQYLGFSEPILNVLPTSIHEPHSSPRPPPGPRSASTRVIETSEHHYFTHPWPHSPVCMASGSPAVHRAETVSTSGLLTEQDQAQHRATVEQGVAMMQAHHKATGDHFPDYMYDQMRDEFLATMNRAFRLAEQDVAARERGRRGHGVSPEGRVGRRDRSIVGRLHDIVAELFGARNAPW
ncbi:hypothetical protein K461DRAFT_281798 [Myriangium duriaei CBS 260.36]|uniref:Uncharacterized protein n=1 Tax=Myriangium duriaei CBS 260.36 TaxID=1168546 RepID=A0A9P4IVU3_9PEZI|nr:hypothetical protein K461DRAFT_281798 [Myriangium duriaei CBS 260.36]